MPPCALFVGGEVVLVVGRERVRGCVLDLGMHERRRCERVAQRAACRGVGGITPGGLVRTWSSLAGRAQWCCEAGADRRGESGIVVGVCCGRAGAASFGPMPKRNDSEGAWGAGHFAAGAFFIGDARR